MLSGTFSICPGCGIKLPKKDRVLYEKQNASAECRALYDELAMYTLSKQDPFFIHQLIVDSYAAQHAGGVAKNISVVFALIGLCLVVEHNYTGRQVQLLHMKIPKQKWPAFEPPSQNGIFNVADVLKAGSDQQLDEFIMQWAREVWESWSKHHDWVRQKTLECMALT